MNLYCEHVALLAADDIYTPKFNIYFHLLSELSFFGHPKNYGTWLDEALNKLLKATCRLTSQSTFDRSVLSRMQRLMAARPCVRSR